MPSIASLIVKIGANDQEIQKALASVGEKAKSLNADLSKLGNSPLAGTAQKSLENLRATMDAITKAQQDIANRATLAAQGLEAMGGASRLTDSQLKQVNKTLQDGLSAFSALGQQAPEDLQKVADAVKGKLDQPLGLIQAKAIALGTALGTALGNAAVAVGRQLIDAAKASFDYADALENLSAATGVSVQGLQRLEAIGETSGTSMQTLATSIEQLQKHLDDPAAVAAIRQMGLDYKTIRDLKPEDQFIEIAQAVAAIQDPVERANAGAALFGKTWSTIAPAIQGNLKDILKNVNTATDEQIKAVDELGDEWDRFWGNLKRGAASTAGAIIIEARRMKDALGQSELGENPAAPPEVPLPTNLPGSPNFSRGTGFISLGFQSADTAQAMRDLDEQIAKTRAEAEHFKQVQDQLFGRAIIANANELVKALGSTDNLTKLTDTSTKKLHDELGQALAAYKALGQTAPALLQAVYDKTAPLVIQARQIGTGLAAFGPGKIPTAPGIIQPNIDLSGGVLTGPTSVTNAARANIFAASGPSFADNLFASVPNAIQAAIQGGGSKLEAAGSALGSSIFGRDSAATKAISGGISKLFGPDSVMTKTLGSAVPVIGSLIGPAIEGLGKLWGKVFGTAGRDAVREFASSQGGFDTLHQKLGALGDDGEKLWKSLTQGVGRNNPEQAKAAIEAVNKAFEAQRQKILALQGTLTNVGGRLSAITSLTPALQSALDKAFSAKNPKDFESALAGINGELDKQKEKFDLIKETLTKYSIPFTAAGKEFKQAQINETAQGLITDFNTLADAGVDVKTEVHGMSDGISKFAQDAKKAGVEVPEDMRKILQAAIDNGELFDENGKKITDMKELGLTFGTTMETVMKKTIPDAIAKLTTVLEGLAKFLGITLPGAAEDGAEDTQNALNNIDVPDLTVHVKTQFDQGNAPDYGGQVDGSSTGSIVHPWGLQHFAQGGIVPPDNRIVAVSDGELIMNVGQQKNVADALRQGRIVIENHFNGPVLAERSYIEKMGEWFLAGIQRNNLPQFGRLVAKVTP